MNTIRRDGADDTGNQDVRGLRRHFLGGNGASQEMPKEANTPHLRDKEDVPHEGSIPDFYGLEDPFEDTAEGQIEAVLLKMVDEGELCFGWIEERQEMGFWRCDDAESCCPTPEPAPEPETKRASHRRTRTTRHPVMSRAMVTLVAAVTAPFAIGVAAYAVDEAREQRKPTVEQADLAAEESPSQTPAPVATPMVVQTPAQLPTANPNSARGGIPGAQNRKKPEHPRHRRHHLAEEHKGHHYRGRHRREDTPATPSTAPVTTLTRPMVAPSTTATPRPTVNEGRRNTQGGLVSEVISPVEALLGRTFR
jgi:hypothetical protein